MRSVRKTNVWVAALVVAASLFQASPVRADDPRPAPAARSSVTRATQSQQNSILRLYRAYFLRDPDRSGLAHWAGQYASGRMSLSAISDFFARSDEFRQRYGSLSDAEFVNLVYQNVLGRGPDNTGANHWTSVLRRGEPRGQIMIGFSESIEFQRKTGTLVESPPPVEDWITEALRLTNAKRSAAGLVPLALCPPLNRAAAGHSADQARRNELTHTGADGSNGGARISAQGYRFTAWAENVAKGYPSVQELLDGWMGSTTHRNNILDPTFRHVGFGRATSSGGATFWTQNFGAGGDC